MNHIKAILILFCLFAAQAEELKDWKMFKNNAGWSIQYPSEWWLYEDYAKLDDSKYPLAPPNVKKGYVVGLNPDLCGPAEPKEARVQNGCLQVAIYRADIPRVETEDQTPKRKKQREDLPTGKEIKIDGHDARDELIGVKGPIESSRRKVTVFNFDETYEIEYYEIGKNHEFLPRNQWKYEKVFEKMLSTFKLITKTWQSVSEFTLKQKQGPLQKGFQKGNHEFCFIYPKYVVRTHDFTDHIGENVDLYSRDEKKDELQNCEVVGSKPIFSINAERDPFWFWGLYQDYLLIDKSSSNIGTFNVYDLRSKKQVLEKSYYDFIGPRFKGNTLSFGRSKGDDRSKCGRPLTEDEESSAFTFHEEEVALEAYDLDHEMKLTTEGKHCELITTQ